MLSRHILIVAHRHDLCADAVILKLRAAGELPVRLNLEDIPGSSHITTQFGQKTSTTLLQTRNCTLPLREVRAIYWRAADSLSLAPAMMPEAQAFAVSELRQLVSCLWSETERYWLSHPDRIRFAQWKARQLEYASAVGFSIPRTMVTSASNQAVEFAEEVGGRVFFKPMNGPAAGPDRMLVSAIVSASELQSHATQLALAPCCFQEVIEKAIDIRILIVGRRVYAVKVNLPAPAGFSGDYSAPEKNLALEAFSLPADVEGLCLQLAANLKLEYLAINLLLTKEGRYVFSECDPLADFLPFTGIPGAPNVAQEIASMLRQHATAPVAVPLPS